MKHYGDITKLSGYELPVVDVITGGSPCQDLSVAGKREGLAGERSGLFMEQIRIVKEMRDHDRRTNGRSDITCRPRFMVWENVPGAFSSNGGKDFQAVLTEIVRIAEPGAPDVPLFGGGKRWDKSGCLYDQMGCWSVAWRVHDAQFWGVPQRRKRIALVADFGGLTAPEVLFEREGLQWDFEQGEEEGEEITGSAGEGVAATITASYGTKRNGNSGAYTGENFVIEKDVNPPVARSLTALMDGSYAADRGPDVVVGHVARTINCKQRSLDVGEEIAATLGANDYKEPQAVCYGIGGYNSEGMKSSNPGGIAVVAIEGNGTRDSHKGDGYKETEIMYTLNSVEQHAVYTFQQYTVRRLTPLECERLQGFPDGWTLIGEPEKVIVKDYEYLSTDPESVEKIEYGTHEEIAHFYYDDKGKKKRCTDSARYKALGNSIALPFWFYLLRRISAQYERPATLGSLFDGIGGFPLCWERCNGPGTAIWASEIEEFPIAVTKARFSERKNNVTEKR